MKRLLLMILGLFIIVSQISAQSTGQWTTLFDGKSIAAFDTAGDANWKVADGVVQADTGVGYLVTKSPYTDFQFKMDFWVDEEANSGVFIRSMSATEIGATSSYEVNIFDKRPDQNYRTGSIVNVAKPSSIVNTAGKWNTIEITAQGSHLVVTVNGIKTADTEDKKYASGRIALQRSAGVVKFRNVQIRPL